jgi:hypothetical protein
MISKYNTIRFILDEAANKDITTTTDTDWTLWFAKVSRVFQHKIPVALLEGLLKLNILKVNELCDEHYMSLTKPINHSELKNIKYHNWIKRRDEGNKRAQELRKNVEARKRAAEIETVIKMQEAEYKKKLPIWQQQYADIVDKRAAMIDHILNPS